MKRKIGVIIDSLKLGVRKGIVRASEMGMDGFQIWVTGGEMAPEKMSKADREEFKRFVAAHDLEIAALCGDLGKGLLDPESNPEVIRRSEAFVDLAVDLGTSIVTTHIGTLPENDEDPAWEIGIEAASKLAAYAEARGCVFASETGPESPVILKQFLDKIPGTGMKINYDPANFIMLGPFDHIGGVQVLKDHIVHTHAKDGVCLMKGENGKPNRFLEVPLGEGGVAFKHYLKALDDIGYTGFLTIEREVGDEPVSDVLNALRFLRSFEQ